jgi:hypothetical protein
VVNRIFGILFVVLLAFPVQAIACGIVYGSNWGFISETPDGWAAACGNGAMSGTAVTLWPKEQNPSASDALIYVTVSDKGKETLDDFIAEDIKGFKAKALKARREVTVENILPSLSKARMVRFIDTAGKQYERVAYVEGPTAYFIVVLSADSQVHEQKYRPVFENYLAAFTPMSVTH